MAERPILYSFRRCPYAMRARMAVWISGETVELREVKLASKPAELLASSPKGTVPVLHRPDGSVLEESLDIMHWALSRNDPEGWLAGDNRALIERNDRPFKHHLDRYKYPSRYQDCDPIPHREAALDILRDYERRLSAQAFLGGESRTLADMAIFPFVRQFANTDRGWFDALPLPRLQSWLEGHLSSEIFAAIMPKFRTWQADEAPVLFGREIAR